MALTFLSLVNQTARRLNEVELTSTNFATARGFYSHMKDAVNASIRHINQSHIEWPFNYNYWDEVLVPGVTRYAFPSDATAIDFESFRLRKDTSVDIDNGKYLQSIPYDEYLKRYVDQEDDITGQNGSAPDMVFRAHNLEWGVVPVPDQPYTITFEYYQNPDDLVDHDDTTNIPDQYRHVIVDGAVYYAYMFRDNKDSAMLIEKKFTDGIKFMRTHLINANTVMASTMRV